MTNVTNFDKIGNTPIGASTNSKNLDLNKNLKLIEIENSKFENQEFEI